MAIQKEIWISSIQEQLYAGNEFIQKSISHDNYTTDKTVHVPQGDTIPAVAKDRSSLPYVRLLFFIHSVFTFPYFYSKLFVLLFLAFPLFCLL